MTQGASDSFCRDCLADAPETATRCPACGSPRLFRHAEGGSLAIAHIDCDAFYATIEKRDDPSLRDRPLIVGGGGRRGVVSTCCYIARMSGVRSAMPMFKAMSLCPDAVVVPPNMEKYGAVGRQVRTLMRELTPLVEPLSIDEAFLDLTGTQALHGAAPARVLAGLARRVEREIGITVSVGLSYNKFLAKIASDLDKPRGFAAIGTAEAATFLADKPVGLIWGVGKASQERLARDGIRTIADLRRYEAATLIKRYGVQGARLAELCWGRDSRRVEPHGDVKSISAEITFESDVSGFRPLEKLLFPLCEKVARRLTAADLSGRTLTLKLKSADFRTRTRSRTLNDPTALAGRIFAIGRDLLAVEAADGTAFRLIGIGVSDFGPLVDADPDDLADPDLHRRKSVEKAVEALRGRFGRKAVVKGIVLDD